MFLRFNQRIEPKERFFDSKNSKKIAMLNKQKIRIVKRLDLQRVKDGQAPIYIRIFVDGRKTEIFSNQSVPEAHWDNRKQEVKRSFERGDLINAYLRKLVNTIENEFYELRAIGQMITAAELKNKILGIEDKPLEKTIADAFDYHNTKMGEQVRIGAVVQKTHLRYIITRNKVMAFIKHQYKKDNMCLKDMRHRFITEFEHYLLTVDKLQSNTAHKYIKNLKKIMKMSVGLDWIPSNPFDNFTCSYTSPNREVLNDVELELLRRTKIENPRLNEVRDVFVFCCYTGFAYSDVYKFDRNAVTRGIDGDYWIITNRQKTGTRESVPLLPIALEIIEKYRNDKYCIDNNKLLPVNSNQRYNSYLKEIAAICNINKKITTHIARHTFATTVTLANGVPIETVSSMLGHTSIRTTQIYAKVVEKKVSEDMKQLKEKLFGAIKTETKERKLG
jgi:site-specific recombinase XerD